MSEISQRPADQWLIRTADNVIAGPYSREQVCSLISDGQLELQDEVCPGGSYWFHLHETEEVRKNLGVSIPKLRLRGRGDEEVTETETETAPILAGQVPAQGGSGRASHDDLPELQEIFEAEREITGFVSRPKDLKSLKIQRKGPRDFRIPQMVVMGAAHSKDAGKMKGWSWVLLLALGVALVAAVFFLFRI